MICKEFVQKWECLQLVHAKGPGAATLTAAEPNRRAGTRVVYSSCDHTFSGVYAVYPLRGCCMATRFVLHKNHIVFVFKPHLLTAISLSYFPPLSSNWIILYSAVR